MTITIAIHDRDDYVDEDWRKSAPVALVRAFCRNNKNCVNGKEVYDADDVFIAEEIKRMSNSPNIHGFACIKHHKNWLELTCLSADDRSEPTLITRIIEYAASLHKKFISIKARTVDIAALHSYGFEFTPSFREPEDPVISNLWYLVMNGEIKFTRFQEAALQKGVFLPDTKLFCMYLFLRRPAPSKSLF